MGYSTTQAANIATLAGAIALILSYFHITIGPEELQLLFGAIIVVVSTCINWYQRYKRGDITLGGFRK